MGAHSTRLVTRRVIVQSVVARLSDVHISLMLSGNFVLIQSLSLGHVHIVLSCVDGRIWPMRCKREEGTDWSGCMLDPAPHLAADCSAARCSFHRHASSREHEPSSTKSHNWTNVTKEYERDTSSHKPQLHRLITTAVALIPKSPTPLDKNPDQARGTDRLNFDHR